MNFEQWYEENESSIYNDPIGAMEQAFKAGQQQYKSLVKTVDADNLPDGLVLALNESKQGLIGDLYEHRGDVFCDDENLEGENCNEIEGITHYIEQKDLLKLINGGLL